MAMFGSRALKTQTGAFLHLPANMIKISYRFLNYISSGELSKTAFYDGIVFFPSRLGKTAVKYRGVF